MMNPMIGLNLGVLRHRVSRRLAGIQLKRGITGQWEYPLLYAAMVPVDIWEVETYILLRQNTTA